MIAIKNVTKKFPSTTALDNISLEIKEKEFFGLLGPNGAGKSTLMNILIGYLDADEGEVSINGQKMNTVAFALRKKIGLVPQSLALYDEITAKENLEIFGSLYGLDKKDLRYIIADKLKMVGLFDRKKDKVKTFSGGMKRRLNLAASLLHNPEIILCDEPTVGIDPQSRNAIFDYLQSLNDEGKTIIYTTHYMEEAERLCSRIAIIDFGHIISVGTLGELLQKLDYKQTISIIKNPFTEKYLSLFSSFGEIIDEQDKYELQPSDGLILSDFFRKVEEKGISYTFINFSKPTLEALFLHLTGRSLRD
ncbi:MAG TPA: ABC transporter ATP-binding protein [Ignavibacteriaceae bacterium]|nr:ABC transporter ATP-binding protein [Ignavibacteriaceae bacterium]